MTTPFSLRSLKAGQSGPAAQYAQRHSLPTTLHGRVSLSLKISSVVDAENEKMLIDGFQDVDRGAPADRKPSPTIECTQIQVLTGGYRAKE